MRHGQRAAAPRRDSGFTLIETLLALLLLAFGLLAAAPMFMYGVRVTAASADVGTVGAAAVKKLESLRQVAFSTLTAGGGVNPLAPVAGYSDATDPAVTLLWQIIDDPTSTKKKTIIILALSTRTTPMGRKSVRIVTLRAA